MFGITEFEALFCQFGLCLGHVWVCWTDYWVQLQAPPKAFWQKVRSKTTNSNHGRQWPMSGRRIAQPIEKLVRNLKTSEIANKATTSQKHRKKESMANSRNISQTVKSQSQKTFGGACSKVLGPTGFVVELPSYIHGFQYFYDFEFIRSYRVVVVPHR